MANLAEDLLRIENCSFEDIEVKFDNNALIVIADKFEFINSNITKASSFDRYGALYILSDSILVKGSKFEDNSAIKGNGGAMYIDSDTVKNSKTNVVIDGCKFINNQALEGTGIYYSHMAINFTATNNHFENCISTAEGGSFFHFS